MKKSKFLFVKCGLCKRPFRAYPECRLGTIESYCYICGGCREFMDKEFKEHGKEHTA